MTVMQFIEKIDDTIPDEQRIYLVNHEDEIQNGEYYTKKEVIGEYWSWNIEEVAGYKNHLALVISPPAKTWYVTIEVTTSGVTNKYDLRDIVCHRLDDCNKITVDTCEVEDKENFMDSDFEW